MIRLAGAEVGEDRRLGDEGSALPVLEAVLDAGAAAAVAEGLGVAQTALSMTVEYLKTREQFGTKIGAFQALQHRAVDMFVEVELLRSISIEASLRVDEADLALRQGAVSAGKVQLSTGGRLVTSQAIQLHGGVGCTDEHDIGLYFKRMQVLASLFGDEEWHVTRYGSLSGNAVQ
jgi:alkylation response protein AidB-like acyl-CoA dehydrogenase